MATLLDTIKQQALTKPRIIQFVKASSDLGLTSEERKRWLSSEEFFLMRVPLSRLSLNYGEIFAETEVPKNIVIVDLNKNKIGRTGGGYTPKTVLLAGAEIIRAAKAKEEFFFNCWVGKKSIKALGLTIKADHQIGSNELAGELRKLIGDKFPKQYAYIVEVYPFENYMIYNLDGETYKQCYKCDTVSRKVSLDGTPCRVFTQYKTATDMASQGVYDDHINDEPDGAGFPSAKRVAERRSLADGKDFGAPTSYLNNPNMYDDLLNVEEALDIYLRHIKESIWRPISSQWAPIPEGNQQLATRAKHAAIKAGVKDFSAADFVQWTRGVKAAKAKGQKVDMRTSTQINAGGPGSGRHPEAGTFKKTSHTDTPDKEGYYNGTKHSYEGKKGTTVDIHYNGLHGVNGVGRVKENGKQVHLGNPKQTASFAKQRYGINWSLSK